MATILLVEDKSLIALSVQMTLEGLGYGVLSESTGKAAIDAVLRGDTPIDLILMDLDLGDGIDGAEAARRILAERDVPVVFLTAHSDQEYVDRVRGITRYGFVVKNSGPYVLQSVVETAFELFATHRLVATSQSRLAALLKTIPDLVWLKDKEGVYIICNPSFELLYGKPVSEIIGKTDYEFVDREQADFFRERDRIAMDSGGPVTNEEWITFASDGHKALQETIKTPLTDSSGRLVGVLGIGRDITERHRLAEELARSVEEKETLLRELQHRVKNSLSLVSSLLSLNLSDLPDEHSRHVFEEAITRIGSVSRLYEELGGAANRIDRVDLGNYLSHVVALIGASYIARSDKLRLVTDFAHEEFGFKRAVSLGLILNELLTNALKYAYPPDSGGEIRIRFSLAGQERELRVSDDGPGLPPGFDPAEAKSYGLRICFTLAAELRGSLFFEPGRGTTAVLRLPAS